MRWSRCLLRCRISDQNQTLTGAGEAHVEQSCMIAAQLCFFLWRESWVLLFFEQVIDAEKDHYGCLHARGRL